MSASFLTTAPDAPDLRIAVEVAWGADLTDLTGASWTWDDITDYVILEHGGGAGGGSAAGGGQSGDAQGGSISIDLGRPDFSAETQTATMVCELDNRDGRFSEGGLSPYWPDIRRGTPVRVQVSPDGGTTWYLRFQGAANGFTPNWPEQTGRWATVTLSASGPLRRINQGTLPAKSVYTTEIPRSTGWDGMFLYWPSEGGDGRQDLPSTVPTAGHPVLQLFDLYPPRVANNLSNQAFPLSGPMQSSFVMFTGESLFDQIDGTSGEQIPSYTNTGILQVRFMLAVPGDYSTPQSQPVMQIRTSNATVRRWTLEIDEAGSLRVVGSNDAGDELRSSTWVTFAMGGTARLVSVTFDNNGSSLDVTIRTVDQLGENLSFAETIGSSNIGVLNGLFLNGTDFSSDGTGTENGIISHVSVQNTTTSIGTASVENVFRGLPGETTQARLTRLCTNHNIALEVLGATDIVGNSSIIDDMGPQYYDTLTELLRECERTGQGLLYDGLGPGLTYATKRLRESNANGPATLVIDAAEGQLIEPFAPIDDDQLTINHCDVSNRNGATASWMDTTGPLGADAIGDYATAYTVCVEDENDLINYAQWTVGLGGQQGYRYPTISFALDSSPELIDDWLACTPTARVDVENIASIRRQHSGETIRLLLEGWHEEIDAFTWRVTANTSSAEPWRVVVLAAATGSTGDGICHLQTEGSQLNANYTSGTTISVRTNTGLRWITTGEDADSFPFDISVGGVKATVTGITSTTSPQTFTLSAALPRTFTGSTTPGPPAAPVEVWRPPVYGL